MSLAHDVSGVILKAARDQASGTIYEGFGEVEA
jgi:hypothetical protein